jgi:glycerol uptake facilitator-like aquaporin
MKAQLPLTRALAGEVLGNYLLVLFGTGSVATAAHQRTGMAFRVVIAKR